MIFKTYISNNDVLKFSNSSEDKNPIHIDEKFSRRQFAGNKVVHGILLVERFFNFFFKNQKYFITKFSCNFSNTCEVNSKLKYNYIHKINRVYCTVFREKRIICYFEFNYFKFSPKIKLDKNIKILKKNSIIRNLNQIKKLINKKRKFVKVYNKKKNIFINILYNISRVIGMEVPGRNSLFSNLNLTYNENLNKKNNFYKVNNVISKVRLIETLYSYKSYKIITNSFLLNSPINFEKILKKKYFNKSKEKNDLNKILIIGGSRGLGLVSTYYFLSKGYKVTSTYYIYDKYLKNIRNKNFKFIKINIESDKDLNKLKKIKNDFNFLMLFASPKILNYSKDGFNKKYFNSMKNYYIKPIKIILENSLENKKVFIPSTSFLNQSLNNEFLEYIKSKRIMENYLKKQNYNRSNIYFPRLPRFSTDQNLFHLKKENIESILKFEKYLKIFEKR